MSRCALQNQGDSGGDVDLYCSRGLYIVPGPGWADYESDTIGVNADQVYIPPLDAKELGELGSGE